MVSVRLEGVSKRFGRQAVVAVDHLGLNVGGGELLAVVGPSGSGKTTLLRLIAGLETPTEGEIWLDEQRATAMAPHRRDMALVFQNMVLYPHLNVLRNLTFGSDLRCGRGVKRFFDKSNGLGSDPGLPLRAAEALGIEGLLERMPWQLSGGEQQRVALARALVRRPKVLLLDEPFSHLDGPLRSVVRGRVKQVIEEQAITAILVTHDPVDALALGDRVAVLREGKLEQVGSPQQVYDWPASRFVAVQVAAAPMNFLRGELETDGHRGRFRRGDWMLPLEEAVLRGESGAWRGPAVLGIRPADISIANGTGGEASLLAAEVSRVEFRGHECLVTASVAGGDAAASGPAEFVQFTTGAGRECRVKESVALRFNPEAVRLFDVETGRSIQN